MAQAIAVHRDDVAELRLIREAAEELGFRVWLFGGTAAAFAHYVRWDLARQAGDARYRDSFFDYDFTNIYRSTQDADLVVDATPQQAEALEALIRQKMSFLQGSKDHWEVRLLRYARTAPGGQVKQALLANPDFLEQNTDSNSTGMIELTDPPRGEGVVRDLRDWESPTPVFLKDVTAGRLHYYWSPTHERTSRFRAGDNPPLFSVIRFLVKAFQYHLTVEGDDLRRVQEIIDAFDPRRDHPRPSPWAQGWLERYGPNLIRHSVDLEYAWNTLEELGLRQKLISLSTPSEIGTLGWWLSREPLRTHPLGEGAGKTAGELGIEVVAHETSDFLAYESMTRDTTLRPNVLISRPGHPGEAASLGPGFYTMRGRSGAAGTGLTIRFTVDPRAREGRDFRAQGDMVVFTNRAALRVIPESLDASMLGYFQMLRDGLIQRDDRGAWMKLRRRLSLKPLAGTDEAELVAIVSGEIDRLAREGGASPLLQEWFAMPLSQAYPELVDALLAVVVEATDRKGLVPLVQTWFHLPVSRSHPELVGRLIDRYTSSTYRERGLAVHEGDRLVDWVLHLPGWDAQPGLIRALLERKMFSPVFDVVAGADWSGQPERAVQLMEHLCTGCTHSAALRLAREPAFWRQPQILARMVARGDPFQAAVYKILTERPERLGHVEMVLALLEAIDTGGGAGKQPWSDSWINSLLEKGGWKEHPWLRHLCGGKDPDAVCLRKAVREAPREEAAGLVVDLAALSDSPVSDADCR